MLLSAVGVHTLSFFVVTGIVAVIVYEVVGLALLRKAWFNMGSAVGYRSDDCWYCYAFLEALDPVCCPV